MIDLSLMRRVYVDAEEKTARVDGGALLGDVDSETQLHGLALPFTHKIGLDNGVPAVYVFRHELTKPNQTDPFEV
jgi:hypothetical protein